jgi:hypothetical protein
MEDLGSLIHSFRLECNCQHDGLILTQRGDVVQFLVEFGLKNCNHVILPMIKNLHLTKDMSGLSINAHLYQHMVGELNFLLQSQLDMTMLVDLVGIIKSLIWML